MVLNIFKGIEEDLLQVHNRIIKEMVIRAGHVGDFSHLEFPRINQVIRPALVILSSRLFGGDQEKTVSLASIVQFIYMAFQVHNSVGEKDSDYSRETGSDPRDGSQFPVLVGDYLYGKFFTFLCGASLINLLGPLAEIICQINEGGVLKEKICGQALSSPLMREVVQKETAELFAGCCRLGARLACAPLEDQETLGRFGFNFGTAFALLELGAAFEYSQSYLKSSLSELFLLKDHPARDSLIELALSFQKHGLPVRQMVG
ncbi:MAG: polyprenyl synthetase family protein [Eubacteriales bacterium]